TNNCSGADDNATGVAGMLAAARVLTSTAHAGTLIVACWDEVVLGLTGSRAYADRARTNELRDDAYCYVALVGTADVTLVTHLQPAGLELLFPDQVQEIEANESRGNFIAAIAEPGSTEVVASLERFADQLGLPFIGLVIPEPYLNSPAIRDLRRSDHA